MYRSHSLSIVPNTNGGAEKAADCPISWLDRSFAAHRHGRLECGHRCGPVGRHTRTLVARSGRGGAEHDKHMFGCEYHHHVLCVLATGWLMTDFDEYYAE